MPLVRDDDDDFELPPTRLPSSRRALGANDDDFEVWERLLGAPRISVIGNSGRGYRTVQRTRDLKVYTRQTVRQNTKNEKSRSPY